MTSGERCSACRRGKKPLRTEAVGQERSGITSGLSRPRAPNHERMVRRGARVCTVLSPRPQSSINQSRPTPTQKASAHQPSTKAWLTRGNGAGGGVQRALYGCFSMIPPPQNLTVRHTIRQRHQAPRNPSVGFLYPLVLTDLRKTSILRPSLIRLRRILDQ